MLHCVNNDNTENYSENDIVTTMTDKIITMTMTMMTIMTMIINDDEDNNYFLES